MKPPIQVIESISARRARIADTDKVRYRVYSTPTEFIAVIAESALMAVRVSGVKKPHKIVRDLPTEGIAIEAKKMAAVHESDERISFPTTPKAASTVSFRTELPKAGPVKAALFEPMGLGDLRRKGESTARILPPELINEIIEDHQKSVAAALPPEPEAASGSAMAAPEPALPPEPVAELTTEEKISQIAEEVFPPEASTLDENGDVVLTPEEVEKLLNG